MPDTPETPDAPGNAFRVMLPQTANPAQTKYTDAYATEITRQLEDVQRRLEEISSAGSGIGENKEPDSDYAAMAEMPAFYVDSWYLTTWKGHVRLAFGEQFEKTVYRTAIVLELDDAERLANRILRAVERRRKRELEPQQNPTTTSKA